MGGISIPLAHMSVGVKSTLRAGALSPEAHRCNIQNGLQPDTMPTGKHGLAVTAVEIIQVYTMLVRMGELGGHSLTCQVEVTIGKRAEMSMQDMKRSIVIGT